MARDHRSWPRYRPTTTPTRAVGARGKHRRTFIRWWRRNCAGPSWMSVVVRVAWPRSCPRRSPGSGSIPQPRNSPRISFRPVVLADMRALPFRNGAFAEVVHLWCLYHLDVPVVAVREAARVLRSGRSLLRLYFRPRQRPRDHAGGLPTVDVRRGGCRGDCRRGVLRASKRNIGTARSSHSKRATRSARIAATTTFPRTAQKRSTCPCGSRNEACSYVRATPGRRCVCRVGFRRLRGRRGGVASIGVRSSRGWSSRPVTMEPCDGPRTSRVVDRSRGRRSRDRAQ